jgi:hypothetical protein
MPDEVITISMDMKDVYEVAKRLDLEDEFKDGLKAGGVYVEGIMKTYPPDSEANRSKPHPGRWYERGYGPRWYNADGGLMGRKTSERLGDRWTSVTQDEGLTVVIGNNATYAPYVHDDDLRPSYHAARGWPAAQDVVRDENEHVTNMISEFIQAGLEGRSTPRK